MKNKINTTGIENKKLYIDKSSLLIPVNLRFFDGEKTEKPTAKKKSKARDEGQVAKSTEVGTAFLFLAIFIGLRTFASYMFDNMLTVFNYSFTIIQDMEDNLLPKKINGIVADMFLKAILTALPIMLVALSVGLIVNIIQVGWHPTTKPLKPKMSKLNPLKGIKNLISFKVLVDLVKSVGKLAVIGLVIYNGLASEIGNIMAFIDMELMQGVAYIANVAVDLGINVGAWYLVIAALDYAYTRYKHTKGLKMSKQEVKDEYKNTEGNPQIKGQIRQKMREASMRRMMQEVPQADVIITNPTHFAVALKYDLEKRAAPFVVAKGMDFLALKIKEIGKENKVEIVENKPLARTLYETCDIGQEIPQELYAAVAEVLSYVYKLKHNV